MTKESLNILFLAPEAVPFAKVGGLADVAGSLPKAIAALGHDVRLMIPRYGTIRSDQFKLEKIGEPFHIPLGPGKERVHLISSDLDDDIPVYLLWNEHYFSSRERVYGFEDDAQRFAVFGRGTLTGLPLLDWKPDLIHTNDWYTGFVPTWLSVQGWREPFYRDIATLFTIHNPAQQGITGRLILTFAQMEELKHLSVEQPGKVNWMAQAIVHADLVNTVSERYAQEILTPEMGMGLAPLLQEKKDKVFGVLNGLDYEKWDPATDPHIPHRFDVETLDRRAANKAALQQQTRIPVRPKPLLIGMVSRLNEVKGMEIMEPVLEWLLGEKEAQFILLGTGQPKYHEMFKRIQSQFPDRSHIFLKFDPVLARRIYAGADIFLMPSVVEPCGLGQMIAMRYGSVPVVRAVGGLADTVTDYNYDRGHSTGFTFADFTPEACQNALEQAMELYGDREEWRKLQERGMKTNFSWSTSAQKYVELYKKAIKVHTERFDTVV